MTKMVLFLVVVGLIWLGFRLFLGERTSFIVSRHFGPYLCRLIGHRRRGDSVRKIDNAYYSSCRRCGAKLYKPTREGEWGPRPSPLETVEDNDGDIREVEPPAGVRTTTLIGLALIGLGASVAVGMLMAPRDVTMRTAAKRPPALAIWHKAAGDAALAG